LSIDEAARLIREGELVAFPTETVYGLGGDATNERAVAKIFEAKGRPQFNPLISHVLDAGEAGRLVQWNDVADKLAARFWPGPLTLVLRARPGLPPALTAGTGTIGVRAPGHPVAAAIVDGLGGPVTAPSANPPGAAPPRRLDEARAYFGDRVDAYVDGGELPGGGSTVASVEGGELRVLRAGVLSEAALRAALGGE